ncbi:hypothetical protein ACQJBY_053864 [Aegilops geniculata]
MEYKLLVSATTGAMNTLLPKLAQMLTNEYKLQKAVKKDIEHLQKELEGMHGALEKVSMVPTDQLDNQVRIWAKEVRDLSYDIEDAVDDFMVRVDDDDSTKSHGFKEFIGKLKALLPTAKSRHDIGTAIQRIKKEVQEVSERRDRYMLMNPVAVSAVIDPRLSALYEDKAVLVGMDGSRDELVGFIAQEDDPPNMQIKVVSIVGFGGLGKTTLANAVYNSFEGQLFDARAFVSVSLKPDIKKILKNILSQLDRQIYSQINEAWDEKPLIDEIRTFLGDKRYLIVIDDIWDKSAWKIIKCAFVENNLGSCVITTTRKVDVATYVGNVYELNQLSIDDSKKLFYTRIFVGENNCPPQLKEISNKILKKCGGVPLAIITIASLLANKPKTEDQWSSVHDSIGSGLEKNKDFDEMRRIMSLSYYDLPANLKSCLLYLCVYPEDYELEIDELVWTWAAEGLIHAKQGQSFRELGESCCIELIDRNMIQLAGISDDGRIRSIRIHDMVLDLITALSEEENFVTIQDGQQDKTIPNKIRRLSLQNGDNEGTVQQATTRLSYVRSVTAFGHINLMPSLGSFHALRVLNLRNCYSLESCYLNGLVRLVHLRYLVLSSGHITDLPEQIGKLQFLQTLDVRYCKIKLLPPSIIRLRQLVRLHVGLHRNADYSYAQLLPHGVGNMRSLQDLLTISVGKSPTLLIELGSLIELRTLSIVFDTWDESYEKPLIECLRSLGSNKIQNLSIQITEQVLYHGHSLDCLLGFCWVSPHLQNFFADDSTFSTLPRWIGSLSNLLSLTINLKTGTQEDISMLGDLPALCYLHLRIEGALEESLVISSDHPFQCLTSFVFFSDVMGLTFTCGALQRLHKLYLEFGLRETIDVCGTFSPSILESLSAIKRIDIHIRYDNAKVCEVQDAINALREAAEIHLNHPILKIGTWKRYPEEHMVDQECHQCVYSNEEDC